MAWPLVSLLVAPLLSCLLLLSFICIALTVVIGIKWKAHPGDNALLWIRVMCGVAINVVRRCQGVVPNGWGHASDSSNVVELTAVNRRELAVAITQWRYTVSLVNETILVQQWWRNFFDVG